MTLSFSPHQIPPWPPADDEIRAVLETAWHEGTWGHYEGAYCDQLVAALQQMHQVEFAYPCSSGTIAVELALRGLKVMQGDEVILAGYDFPGNFRAIEAIGAKPVLVDVVPGGWTLDPAGLEQAYSPLVKAVIASHMHGTTADMAAICQWGKERRVAVLEDACQMPGATVQGKLAGTWGDCSVLSFGGSKLLTAGRGGAILTPSEEVFQRIKLFCDRGNQAFPLSQLQAAVLLPQITKLEERNRYRFKQAEQLRNLWQTHPNVVLPVVEPGDRPSYYKLGFQWNGPAAATATVSPRDELVTRFRQAGLPLDSGFRGFAKRTGRRCRVATALKHSILAADQTILLHHPVLLGDDRLIALLGQAVLGVLKSL